MNQVVTDTEHGLEGRSGLLELFAAAGDLAQAHAQFLRDAALGFTQIDAVDELPSCRNVQPFRGSQQAG